MREKQKRVIAILLLLLIMPTSVVDAYDLIDVKGLHYAIDMNHGDNQDKMENQHAMLCGVSTEAKTQKRGKLILSDEIVHPKTGAIYTVTKIEAFSFLYQTELKKVVFPNSLEVIQDGAFYENSALTYIDIPKSVTTIGSSLDGAGAFENCTSLKYITFLSDQPPNIVNENTFHNIADKVIVYVPAGSKKKYQKELESLQMTGELILKETIPMKKLSFADKKVALREYQTYQLSLKRIPSNSTERLTYYSTNSKVAKVGRNGMIYSQKEGKTSIIVRSSSGVQRSIPVTVTSKGKK